MVLFLFLNMFFKFTFYYILFFLLYKWPSSVLFFLRLSSDIAQMTNVIANQCTSSHHHHHNDKNVKVRSKNKEKLFDATVLRRVGTLVIRFFAWRGYLLALCHYVRKTMLRSFSGNEMMSWVEMKWNGDDDFLTDWLVSWLVGLLTEKRENIKSLLRPSL